MIYHECDQISEDIQMSEIEIRLTYEIPVSLSLETVEQLVEYLAGIYTGDAYDFEDLLEHTLDRQERLEPFLHDIQRKCYKKCLGKIFGRRGAVARENKRRYLESIGFDGPF